MQRNASQIVYDKLLEKINSKELLPGMPLPPENNLTSEFGFSRPTIRKALERLENEKLIVKKAGIGTYVNSREGADSPAASKRRLTFAIDSYGSDYYSGILLQGMKMACEKCGCQISISGVDEFLSTGRHIFDGLVLTSANAGDFDHYAKLSASSGVPIAVINRFPVQSRLSYFSVDYVIESFKAVNYLISIGHRDIAMLGTDTTGELFGLRTKGWAMAFEKNGLAVPERLSFPVRNFWEDVNLLVEFLKRERPTALFVSYGIPMPQIVHALGIANMRIPDDVSLICFDDLELMSDTFGMSLSYVKMPLLAMGRRVAEHLIRRNEDPACKPARALFEASLVINSSCRPLNSK